MEPIASERLKNYKLTDEEKRKLLLSVRLVYVSKEELVNSSTLPLFKPHKDIFIEAIAAKLS